jgi:hypothetical protein
MSLRKRTTPSLISENKFFFIKQKWKKPVNGVQVGAVSGGHLLLLHLLFHLKTKRKKFSYRLIDREMLHRENGENINKI